MWKHFGASLLIYELFYYALSQLPPFFRCTHTHLARFFFVVSSRVICLVNKQHTLFQFPIKNKKHSVRFLLIVWFVLDFTRIFYVCSFQLNGNALTLAKYHNQMISKNLLENCININESFLKYTTFKSKHWKWNMNVRIRIKDKIFMNLLGWTFELCRDFYFEEHKMQATFFLNYKQINK